MHNASTGWNNALGDCDHSQMHSVASTVYACMSSDEAKGHNETQLNLCVGGCVCLISYNRRSVPSTTIDLVAQDASRKTMRSDALVKMPCFLVTLRWSFNFVCTSTVQLTNRARYSQIQLTLCTINFTRNNIIYVRIPGWNMNHYAGLCIPKINHKGFLHVLCSELDTIQNLMLNKNIHISDSNDTMLASCLK